MKFESKTIQRFKNFIKYETVKELRENLKSYDHQTMCVFLGVNKCVLCNKYDLIENFEDNNQVDESLFFYCKECFLNRNEDVINKEKELKDLS